MTPLSSYTEFLYINRGYAFFAPDPGPSHLIQAAITSGDGNRVERLYPDLDDQQPRLLYHRHFMLAEFLNEIYEPPGPPQELAVLDPEGSRDWEQSRARYEYVRQSIVDHLRHKNTNQDVAIRRIEHLLPSFIDIVNDPIELNDERLYRVLLDQPILDEQLPQASVQPEAIPAPKKAEPAEQTMDDANVEIKEENAKEAKESSTQASNSEATNDDASLNQESGMQVEEKSSEDKEVSNEDVDQPQDDIPPDSKSGSDSEEKESIETERSEKSEVAKPETAA